MVKKIVVDNISNPSGHPGFEVTVPQCRHSRNRFILSAIQNKPSPAKNSEVKCIYSFLLLRVSCAVVGSQGTFLCLAVLIMDDSADCNAYRHPLKMHPLSA